MCLCKCTLSMITITNWTFLGMGRVSHHESRTLLRRCPLGPRVPGFTLVITHHWCQVGQRVRGLKCGIRSVTRTQRRRHLTLVGSFNDTRRSPQYVPCVTRTRTACLYGAPSTEKTAESELVWGRRNRPKESRRIDRL